MYPSSIETGDSEETKQDKHEKKKKFFSKKMVIELENQSKMGPPFIYRGEPNVKLFQKWKFTVEMWVRTNYI